MLYEMGSDGFIWSMYAVGSWSIRCDRGTQNATFSLFLVCKGSVIGVTQLIPGWCSQPLIQQGVDPRWSYRRKGFSGAAPHYVPHEVPQHWPGAIKTNRWQWPEQRKAPIGNSWRLFERPSAKAASRGGKPGTVGATPIFAAAAVPIHAVEPAHKSNTAASRRCYLHLLPMVHVLYRYIYIYIYTVWYIYIWVVYVAMIMFDISLLLVA